MHVDAKRFKVAIQRFLALYVLFMMATRAAGERSLATIDKRCGIVLHYFEQMRYDETPMRFRVQDAFRRLLGGEEAPSDASTIAVVGSKNIPIGFQCQSSDSTNKLLQTEQSRGAVLELSGGSLFLLMAAFPTPLLLVENESAAVMTNAVIRNVGTTRWAEKFPHRSRLATTDGHPSNRATERQLDHIRHGWLSVWIWCELHLVAIIFKESLMSMCVPFTRGGPLHWIGADARRDLNRLSKLSVR